MNQREWQCHLHPDCRGEAQEAVAQLRALGILAELRRGDALVITLEDTEIDHRASEIFERVWPGWRDCITD